jgi:Dna[CI] antecedent, DciA
MNRASASLESVISKVLHRSPAEESPLLAWPVACGSAVADRTRALSFVGGVLRVEVADKGWQRELTSLAPRYVAEINRFSAARVERIEFVVKV